MAYEKKKRRISIIMAIYNCAPTLREAIDSIIAQTYTNWELILCDDCSTDNTAAIAQEYVDKYDNILLIRNERNLRLAASLNHCLEYADSEYIGRMDGDDISLPERFEEEVAFLDAHPEYALVSCGMINFDENGDWGVQLKPEKPTKKSFVADSPFCHAPVLMRREALNDVDNYTVRDDLKRGQDYFLWHKFYMKGYKGYNIQRPYYKMRDDQEAATRRGFNEGWTNRIKKGIMCSRVKYEVLKDLDIPLKYRLYSIRPLLVALFPKSLYMYLHKKKINSRDVNI